MNAFLAGGIGLALVSAGPGVAGAGMEITAMRPFPSLIAQGGPIMTLSLFTPRLGPISGFEEWGGVWLPPWNLSQDAAKPGIQEFAGLYAGHVFLPFGGWIRPGFQFGWVWQKARVTTHDGNLAENEGLSFYYGGKVQFSCLTFTVSNKGIGGGINFSL